MSRFAFVGIAILSPFLLALTFVIVSYHYLGQGARFDEEIESNADAMIMEGRQTFRFDTFRSEAFWGDQLRLHEAIAGEANGGVGPGVSPQAALDLGLKVDVEALPADLKAALAAGEVDLDDPANTLVLLQNEAVVGVKGFFAGDQITSIGIQCALCHSTVDNSLAPGIGERLDGWPNRDLNVGAITAIAPNLQPFSDLLDVDVETVIEVLQAWGPGKFDAELILDGKGFRPDGKSAATVLPAAFGLAGVNLHTYTGWGSVTHWNAFVSNLEMHGQGTFFDPRLDDEDQFPIAAREGFGNVRSDDDRITEKLAALHFYQLAIPAPEAPPDSFDADAAARGEMLFKNEAQCATCHVPPLFTEPGWNMHTPEEIGIDDFQANRSPDRRYRTTPLGGLWTHTKGGFYHDGRFATLRDVVDHYDAHLGLSLSSQNKNDLAEYLMSLGGPATVGTSIGDRTGRELPTNISLGQNYPNPFNPSTTITYEIARTGPVTLDVYTITGQLVRRLIDAEQPMGRHTVAWDGRNSAGHSVASGVYIYRLHSGDSFDTKKMVVVK